MLVRADPAEAVAVLGAMKAVALHTAQRRIVPVDRMLLEAAGMVVFDPPVLGIDPEGLEPVPAEALASRVTDPEVRATAGTLLVLTAVTGQAEADRLREAVRYCHHLGIHEGYVHDLAELARGHQAWVKNDLLRRNLATFPGLTEEMRTRGGYPYTGTPEDQALAARYRALGELPAGSFGRAFFEHFVEHGFAFPGEVGGLTEAFAGPHDSIHVLSGYGTSTQGELLVSAFTAGMHADHAVEAHILPTMLEWQVGLDLSFAVLPEQGWFDPRKSLIAIERGRAMTFDVLAQPWDVFAHAERDLEQLRAEFGIPPLDPLDAGIGIEPHGR
jgi:hypothetical protein